ncbi:MAG: hypothetical protein V1744_01860 [Candidatus Altiarchaeota archaeon]
MDEPTDRGLAIQGITRNEYDSMNPEAKSMIAARTRRIVELSNITLAADLLNAMADVDDESREYIAETIDGKHPEFEAKIRSLVNEYLNANVESKIGDYYKIKYGGASVVEKKVEDKTPRYSERIVEPAVAKPVPAAKPVEAPSPAAPRMQPSNPDERRGNIAVIISQFEKTSVESVMKVDSDVIRTIMTIADENMQSGVTDESVCKACEAIIREGSQVQYYMEALMPEHRERLLGLARVSS